MGRSGAHFCVALAGLLLCACGGAEAPGASPAALDVAGPAAADTTRPSVALTSPANFDSGLTGRIVASAVASDDVGVESVAFEVDGAQVGRADTRPPYRVTVDTGLYPAGQHVIRARARDAAGNLSAWSSATVRFASSREVPSGFTIEASWVAGLVNATAFAQLPDGRFLIAQQGGALRVVKGDALLATPFVQLSVDASGERGLLGVAPHPDFAANGYVYLYYTTPSGGVHNRVSRFTADGDVALAGSEVVLFDLPPLIATNHNGGAIHFGRDGKLYVGVGDNARSATAPDLTQPLGKLLRFNDDGSIPPDNPFFDTQSGLARAIWAYGLRNPFSFAIHPGTGVIHINDVGQNTWEEIDVGKSGANYGWPASEGPDNLGPGIAAPLFAYKHDDAVPPGSGPGGFFVGQVIAGGTFYPSGALPFPKNFRNNYYFADFAGKWVGRIDLARRNAAYAFATLSGQPVDLTVGADGALYVLTRKAVTRIRHPRRRGSTPRNA